MALVALVMSVSFWSIGNALDHSVVMQKEMEIGFDRTENQYAVRQKETTTSSAFGFFLLGGMGAACWAMSPHGSLRWNKPLFWLAMLYIGWAGFSLLWSVDPMQTVRKLTILGLMLVGALGIGAKFTLEEFLEIIVLVVVGFAAVGVLAEIHHGTFRPWKADYRFSGTMHPNDQGLNCAILAMAAWMLEGSTKFSPTTRRILVLAGLTGLWFSKSRTTLAGLVIAGIFYLILRSRGSNRWLALSSALSFAAIAALVYSLLSVSVLKQTINVAEMGRNQNVSTLSGRLPLWRELLHDAAKKPAVGRGYGAFWGERNILEYSERNHWHIPHAHNAYLDLVLGTGVIGLVLYAVWVLATIGVAAVRYERTGRVAQLFVVCALAFSLVHGVTESKIPGAGVIAFAILTMLMMEAVQRSAWQERCEDAWAPSLAPQVRPRLAPRIWRGIVERAPRSAFRI
jgi:exopolysaccharide production protein ExoQ